MYCLKIILTPNLEAQDVTKALEGKDIQIITIIDNILWVIYK
jgi:hypothetical protein